MPVIVPALRSMKSEISDAYQSLAEISRPFEEPRPDTMKRVAGSVGMLAVASLAPNKLGYTYPVLLTLSDAIGIHGRYYANKVVSNTSDGDPAQKI
jgi:hypothetical protein